MIRRVLLLAALLGLAMNAFAASGKILILNSDKPGVGFNDPTPAAPVGGNNGTTLGEQRLNVFNEAARRWQNSIDIKVDVLVTATFAPIPGCSATSAVLGQASPLYWKHSFAAAPRANVWFPAALANTLSGTDLEPSRNDILTQFNADVDNQTCLGDIDWYYGFDGNHGNDVDLFVVVLHELAHGLGVSGKTGGPALSENRPAAFHSNMLDLKAGLHWDQMSDEQRLVSITNTGNLVWDGENVRKNVHRFLTPTTMLTITQPAPIARNYDIGTAGFGPPARNTALSGRIVQALDGTDATSSSTKDGCSALTNASSIAGNIALIDRNNCTFVTKVLNAQAAGAKGVIIANMPSPDRAETCYAFGMGGTSTDVRIPVVSLSTSDGAALKAQLDASATVSGRLGVDPSQLAGASTEGYVRLYAPCEHQPGSSTYHWDVVASPNLLMEPDVSSDLLHGLDLTLYQLLDIGWTLPPRSGRTVLRR